MLIKFSLIDSFLDVQVSNITMEFSIKYKQLVFTFELQHLQDLYTHLLKHPSFQVHGILWGQNQSLGCTTRACF